VENSTNIFMDSQPKFKQIINHLFKKPLHQVSPHLQRMLFRLQKYDLAIRYVKGKHLYVADTLSRAHQHDAVEDIDSEEIQLAMHSLLNDLLITERRLVDIQQAINHEQSLYAN